MIQDPLIGAGGGLVTSVVLSWFCEVVFWLLFLSFGCRLAVVAGASFCGRVCLMVFGWR